MKIITEEEFKKRIANTFQEQPFEILEYTKVTKPLEIKCLKCNRVSHLTIANNLFQRKNLCQFCYSENSNFKKHEDNKNKIQQILKQNPNLEFIRYDYDETTKKHLVVIKCLECGRTFSKTFQSFLLNSKCMYCQSKNYLDTDLFQKKLPQDFSLMSEYINTDTKVLLRHTCGFTFSIKPHSVIAALATTDMIKCPRCNKRKSKGELKIINFLKENDITFENEKNFPWSTNKRFRYDFYLPDYNLVIEYMGQQHYIQNNFFDNNLQKRIEYDSIKKEDCLKNNLKYLAISYLDYPRINNILSQWFNDYSQEVG